MEFQNSFLFLSVFLPTFAAVVTLLLAKQNRAQRWIGVIAGAVTWGMNIAVLIQVLDSGVQTYRLGGHIPPYGIVMVADLLSTIFALMGSTVMMAGLMYTVHSHEYSTKYPIFVPMFLFMATGLTGCFYTGDLFSFFVFIELMVLASVSLVATSDSEFGLEAAIKYIFISSMGTVFLLMGIAAMYVTFGTLNLAEMGSQLVTGERPLLATTALIMLTCAFLLKSAVFPFHFWQPDFHTPAPTAAHAMLSSVIVKVGVYGVIRIQTLLFANEAEQIQQILVVLGIVGIFFGSLCALRTYNAKRMLAYSTIGQIGFILVAIGWGGEIALAAAIIYAVNHAFVKSALLMTMGLVGSYNKEHSTNFADIGGIGNKIPPIIGMIWFLGAMSLAGLPPMNGFISKLMIVQSGIQLNEWLWVGLAVGSGVLTMMYMFSSWQRIFQTKKEVNVTVLEQGEGIVAPAFLIGLCILLGVYARPLVVLAERAAAEIGDPSIYINAVSLFGG